MNATSKLTVWIVPIFVVGDGIMVFCLQISVSLCLSISYQFFILFSLTHIANSSHSTKTLVILHGNQVAILVIVTGGTHRVLAPVVPEGNVPQEEMSCTRKCAVWPPLHQRNSLSTWAWRQVQVFSPGAHRKQQGQCLTFLQAASPVLLRKARELWLNTAV